MTSNDKLNLITACILAGTPIQFDYVDSDGDRTKDRIVDASSTTVSKKEGVRVGGTCRLRGGYREFKLDSMSNVVKYEGLTVKVGDFVQRRVVGGYDTFLVVRTEPYRVTLVSTAGNPFNGGFSTTSGPSYLLKHLIGGIEPANNWRKVEAKVVVSDEPKTRYFRGSGCIVDLVSLPDGTWIHVSSTHKHNTGPHPANWHEIGVPKGAYTEVSSASQLRYDY